MAVRREQLNDEIQLTGYNYKQVFDYLTESSKSSRKTKEGLLFTLKNQGTAIIKDDFRLKFININKEISDRVDFIIYANRPWHSIGVCIR